MALKLYTWKFPFISSKVGEDSITLAVFATSVEEARTIIHKLRLNNNSDLEIIKQEPLGVEEISHGKLFYIY